MNKNFLHLSAISALILGLSATAAHAEVLKLALPKKTYCNGDEHTFQLSGRPYVERMVVTTEGIRNDGFIKVIADGREVQNIGVPGYDPSYSFRVRLPIDQLRLKFEGTCFKTSEVQLYVDRPAPSGYRRYVRANVQNDNWGDEVLAIVNSLTEELVSFESSGGELWSKVLKPLKRQAMITGARESVRHSQSLYTARSALELAKMISSNQPFLDSLLFGSKFDFVVKDVLTIKEDILERYSVREKKIDEALSRITSEIED
jgi:hypothetical protein